MKFDAFLSHNSKDKPTVEKIAHMLEARGLNVWLDKWNLVPGDPWQEDLENALDDSQTVVVFVGPNSISPWENEEMRAAIEERVQDKTRRVIPVLLPGAPDNKTLKLPRFLKRLTWVDLRVGLDNEDALHRLEFGIKGIAPGKTSTSRTKPSSTTDEIPSVGDLPLGSYLPFSPNPLFTGRVDGMRKLADALVNHAQTGTVITQAITGMGGLGKTQLAVEFAWRYGNQFCGVHWLNLADPGTLDSEIASCGGKMGLDHWADDQPSQVAMTELAWKAQGPRLLILDNFEDVAQANYVLPRLRHSNIRLLVTSRHSDWPPTTGLSPIPLNLFSKEESLAFLKESMKKRKDKDDELNTLSERLGYLPLALELASRYLNDHPRLAVSDYLEKAKDALEHASMNAWRKDILGLTPTQHDTSLLSTFALSWQAVKDEIAQKVFQSAGYLAPNTAIPLEIFEKTLKISSEQCDEALTLLYGLGLLRESESLPTIHPLLAEYARGHPSKNDILTVLAGTMAVMCTKVNEYGIPNEFVPLRAHLEYLARATEANGLSIAGSLWNNIGFHYREIAAYVAAKEAHNHGIAIKQKIYGENAKELASDYNNLGAVMYDLGDLEGARAAFECALKINEATFGLDHPEVAVDVNNLGLVMDALGDLDGARAAYERALKIDETAFGPDHPNVAIRVNNLGEVMRQSGDLVSARTAFERAIKIWETNFGTDHPKVATGVNNLGGVMQAQGDLVGARAAFERALKIDETSLGPDHPKVAIRVNNLGGVMKAQGDLVSARMAYERALKIDETSFGSEHPKVALRLWWLGVLAKDEGDKDTARKYYERALQIYKKFLPSDHPNIKGVQGHLDSLG